jgi:hypothetical protein
MVGQQQGQQTGQVDKNKKKKKSLTVTLLRNNFPVVLLALAAIVSLFFIAIPLLVLAATLLLNIVEQKNISSLKDSITVIQSCVTIVAVISGAVWYFLRRKRYPRANISQEVIHRKITNEQILVHVTTTVTNIGEVRLEINDGYSRLRVIGPKFDPIIEEKLKNHQDPHEGSLTFLNWPLDKELKLNGDDGYQDVEPGESGDYYFDFVIENKDKYEVIIIETMLQNNMKPKIFWHKSTVYDIK